MVKTPQPSIPKTPLVAVDTLIFTVHNQKLAVLLAQIGSGPYLNHWALPGGLVQVNESLDEAAERVLHEKAGVNGIYLEQLYTFGEVNRDKRSRSISVAYNALVNNEFCSPRKTDYNIDIAWHSVEKLPKMAFDHKEMIEFGVERLQNKLGYTNIAYALLPKEFTLSELQLVYEAILGRELDKRNFRKKIQATGLVKGSGKKRHQGVSRPAQLFVFAERKPRIIDVL
jgi:8-oxo-dGTP diphosphatase